MRNIHQRIKRWMAMLLACVMVFTLCPFAAFAEVGVGSNIVVSNVQLSANTVQLTGLNDEQYIQITADLDVPADFDGTQPFFFWFQEQVPEEQYRGYDEVYATKDDDGNWKIDAQIKVSIYWPEGTYLLSHVSYENHDRRVDYSGNVSLTIDRSTVTDNVDPKVTGITVQHNDQPVAGGVDWNENNVLKIRVAVDDENALTEHGNMVLRSSNNARYEAPTDYVETQQPDSTVTREMVLTVNAKDLEPGVWHIEHFTVDDVYGNYAFYNYNGDETDGDGDLNGNDDLLDDVFFEITSDAKRVFFINEDLRWSDSDGFYVELKDANGNILTGLPMAQLEDGIGGWVWYAWIDGDHWNQKHDVTVYRGNGNTAADFITTDEMTADADTLIRTFDENGNEIAGLDTFGDQFMENDDGSGSAGHHIIVYSKDNAGNLNEWGSCDTASAGKIDLSDEGLELPMNVEDFVFPDDAGQLKDQHLQFVGWWVQETNQVITNLDNSDEIDTDSYEIHIYPMYESAPVRLQAHYVNADGEQITYTKWFQAEYTDTLADLEQSFTYPTDHIGDHTFEGWWNPMADTDVMTPNVEGEVFVAEYDELYFTLNYEYLVNVELNGGYFADWCMESVTVFVSDSNRPYGDSDVYDYFLNELANGLTHADGMNVQSWECIGWQPGDNNDISFGNCYGIRADYGMTRLYFLNTDNLWNTENGLYMQVQKADGTVTAEGNLISVPGSQPGYCWYMWVADSALEDKENLRFTVYNGQDNQASSWTKSIEMPGDSDMVVLVGNDAPAAGEFDAGSDRFNMDAWYMQGEQDGPEGPEGPGGEGGGSGTVLRVYDVTFNGDPNANILEELVDNMQTFEVIHVEAKLEVSEDFDGQGGFDIGFGPAGTDTIENGFGSGNIRVENIDGVWTLFLDITLDYFIRPGTFVLTTVDYIGQRVQNIESYVQFTLDRSQVTDNELPVISAPVISGTFGQDDGGQILISIPVTDAHGSRINDEELVLQTDDPNVPEGFNRYHFGTTYNAATGALEATIDAQWLYAAQWYISELQVSDSYGNATRYHAADESGTVLQGATFTVVDSNGDPAGTMPGTGGEVEGEPAGEFHIMVGAAVEGGIELFVDFMTGGAEINVADAIEEMAQDMPPEMLPELEAQVDKLLAAETDGYTFPEEANNGCSNQQLQFVGWYVPATGEIFDAITDVVIHTENLEGQDILVVAKYEAVPMRLEAGYVNADGVFEVYTKWYSLSHGTSLDDVRNDFAGELEKLGHTQAYRFQDWEPVEEYQVRDDLVTPEICSLSFVAIYEKKYVTINYCYLADVTYEENGTTTVKKEEVNCSKTIFVEDAFTDKNVADYFREDMAGTLSHTGGKTPVWNYDEWIPSPEVSGNANCYGIYATYPAVMDETKKQEAEAAIENAAEGETVNVDMSVDQEGGETEEIITVIPAELLQAAKEKNVDVVFDMGGYSWTVSGDSIQEGAADINLGIHTDVVLPDAAIEGLGNVSGEGICLSIAHDGDFGFEAKLTIPGGVPGLFASLYYYVEELGKLMFLHAMQVGEDGNISFDFNHASEYLLVLSEEDISQRVAWADLDCNWEEDDGEVFSSLHEAVAAVNALGGDETVTVRLFRSFEENEPIVVTGKVILDLNDWTLSGNSSEKNGYSLITNNGELTICNGTVTYCYDGAEILSTGTGYDSIRQFANSETLANEVTIQGGIVGSIWQQNPSNDNQEDVRASLDIIDGQVDAVYYEPSANASLAICGGTIGSITTYDAENETDASRIPANFITGGTFLEVPDEGMLAENFAVMTDDEGTIRVEFTKVAEFCQYSVILGQDFGVKFYMHIREDILCDEHAYISFTIDDKEERVPVYDWTLNRYGNVYYETFTFHVAPADIDEEFTAKLVYTDGETGELKEAEDVATSSISTYLDYHKENETLREVVAATATYGSYAKQYFKRDNNAPTPVEDEELKNQVTVETLEGFRKESGQGDEQVRLESVGLLLKSETIMRLFFKVDEDVKNNFVVTLGDCELMIQERGGLHYVDIEGIVAQDLDKDVTVQVSYEGVDAPVDVTCSPLTYCYNVLRAGDQCEAALKNVVRALYLYNQSAKNHFAKQE